MIDLDEIRGLIDQFRDARGKHDDGVALALAERIIYGLRPALAPSNVMTVQHKASRSLWRHAKSGALENYMAQSVLREFIQAALRRADISQSVRLENLDEHGIATTVPKRMIQHVSTLSALILPVKE